MRDGLAIDKWTLCAVAVLLALGLTMVLSTSYLYSQERYADGTYFFRKQMIAMGAGAILLVICSAKTTVLSARTTTPSGLLNPFIRRLTVPSALILSIVP